MHDKIPLIRVIEEYVLIKIYPCTDYNVHNIVL